MIELTDKTALVTGAGTRLGAEIARALGAARMRVAVHYHTSQAGALVICDEIQRAGGQATLYQADLSDSAQCQSLIDRVLTDFGGLDLLVPSAANFERVAVTDITDEHLERALGTNLLAPFHLVQRAAPALRVARGSVVFITCSSRVTPYRDYLPYEVSKAALHQMMRVLALELAPEVRVNAVAPGTVLPPTDMSTQTIALLDQRVPLSHAPAGIRARSVAEAVLYLARASFVTGSEILVDGGRSVA